MSSEQTLATAQPPVLSPVQPCAAPVAEVTVLEDRAHVTRRGRMTLAAGSQRIWIADVAPVISDRTLSATVDGAGAQVIDARVKRVRRARLEDRPEQIRELEQKIEAQRAEIAEKEKRIQTLIEAQKQLAAMVVQTLKEFSEDASWGRASREIWKHQSQTLSAQELALNSERRSLNFDVEEMRESLHHIEQRLQTLLNPSSDCAAGIEVLLHLATPGEINLRVDYIVPAACWRPWHTARLQSPLPLREGAGGGVHPLLTFECGGCVWQNTGEDWTDVQLSLSTQRPSLGTEPPLLSSDLLFVQKKRPVTNVSIREEEVHDAGLGGGGTSSTLPGVDDGGVVRTLKVSHKTTVPSDGRPWRVDLFTFEAPAAIEHICAPELQNAVIIRSTQANAAPQPLLAGPVDLIRDSGYAGRTSVLFIAPGEKFELGWGPDSEIRIHRVVTVHDEEKSMISTWLTRNHHVELRISNIGASPRSIEVTERVPVSEIDRVQIVVDEKKTSGQKKPDADGFIKWTVALKPHGREKLDLYYAIRKKSDVQGV
ncbi:MAG TPA: mucoidy inhibitor MuiA family protein [Planctomycetota bacterium]|nr:mucoidy inhibitor MuiA family protein [Planctomycetota bacterium]